MSESVVEHTLSPSEYISEHLQNLNSLDGPQTSVVDFSVINYDTIFWSVTLGLLMVFVLAAVARRATSGVPGRFQALVEVLVEMVENQSKSIVHGDRTFVAPLALCVFVWIVMMNAMDLIPLDWLHGVNHLLAKVGMHVPHHKVVATADLNGTLGLSLSVLLICLYYNIKIKGFGGWTHELFNAPFGSHPLLYPVNFAMQMVEFVAKTVSHGMRLFGNMYAGELIFMLISLMGAAWAGTSTSGMLWLGHIVAGSVWAIFHILIILLQAFVFMMLTLVYVGQAHDSH